MAKLEKARRRMVARATCPTCNRIKLRKNRKGLRYDDVPGDCGSCLDKKAAEAAKWEAERSLLRKVFDFFTGGPDGH